MNPILLLSLAASIGAPLPSSPDCDPSRQPAARTTAQWTSWGGDLKNTRFQPSNVAGLSASDAPRLELKWAFSLGSVVNARSQPVVAGGRMFVGTEAGEVYSLDAATGCTWWHVKADLPVRSALVYSPATQGKPAAVYFGDVGANVYAVDAATGSRLWKTHVDEHRAAVVSGTPQAFDGVLYVPVSSYESVLPLQPTYECCTFRGSVVALDASSGKTIWKTYMIDDSAAVTGASKTGAKTRGPSGAAVWSTPTIDARLNRIYIGTGNNYSDPVSPRSDAVVALDRRTGKIVWSKQYSPRDAYNSSCDIPGKPNCPASDGQDADFGQPPMLARLPNGKRVLVIGQKSGQVHALDPDRDGAPLWSVDVAPGGKLGGIHWGSATDARNVYVAIGGQTLRVLPDSTVKEGYKILPDPALGGGLVALNLADGKVVWKAPAPQCGQRPRCSPAQSAPVTAIPGLVFSGSVDGHLRAYATTTGQVVWDVDTARDFETVNGTPARGGSLDVAGPVVVGGMVYVMSGYALWSALPGNVLLAFGVGGN